MSSLKKEIGLLSLLLLLTGALFAFKLGATGLLDPDEPFYSLTAKEMLQSHEMLTPILFGKPQFEKPILSYWIFYACFKIFGIHEFSARLGPCLAGILTVFLTYFWARILFRRREPSFISAAILASSCVFLVLARIVLTDMFFCFFVTAALFSFSAGYADPKRRKTAWNLIFVFCALGFLTKGPLGVLLPFFGIASFLLLNEEPGLLKEFPWVTGLLFFAVVGLPWYAEMTLKHGTGFLRQFFIHENIQRFFTAEHPSNDKPFFYPLALWAGFFPWSIFLPSALWRTFKKAGTRRSREARIFLFLAASFAPSFFFFMMAKSKLISYIFPLFPVVALMAGAWVYRFWRGLRVKSKPTTRFQCLCGFFWGILPAAIVAGLFVYDRQCAMGLARPIFFIACSFVPLFWTALFLMKIKKYRLSFAMAVAAVLCGTALAFGWLLPAADETFSCKKVAAEYQNLFHPGPDSFILASKLFVRGISYYTGDKNVGVFAEDPRKVFYTAHPIPILSTRDDFLKISQASFPVYCILRPKELEALKRTLRGSFTLSLLKADSQRVFARLDRAPSAP
jgi:Dolichyl-phosphate-mannose-protein mannosyltransferase